MKKFIIILSLCFSCFEAFSQFNLPGGQQITDKEVKVPLEDEGKEAVLPKGVLIDTVKYAGKKILQDSLHAVQQVIDFPISLPDSTTLNLIEAELKSIAKDSLQSQIGAKEKAYLEELKRLESLKSIPKDSLDDYAKKTVSERGEEWIKNTEEYKALSDVEKGEGLSELQEYQRKVEQIEQETQEAIAKDALKQKMVAQGRQFATEHMEQIQQVQEQMADLKKKYTSITDSDDLSSAVKRTSLEDEPVWKRMVLGGTFNITKTNPLSIDISPVIGYKFNKRFEAGITAAYRTQFTRVSYNINQSSEAVHGFSIFASHFVLKSFFAYVETERMKTTGTLLESPSSSWKSTLLLGIGKRFTVTKWLEMQTVIAYNVLHDRQQGVYSSPVVFKTSIRKR